MPAAAAIPPGPHAGRVWHDPVVTSPALLRGCAVRQLTNYRGHSHHGVGPAPCWLEGGRRLVLVSDREGCGNLFVYDFTDASLTQLTDLRGADRPVAVAAKARGRLIFHYGTEAYELDTANLGLRLLAVWPARARLQTRPQSKPDLGETIAPDGRTVIWVGRARTPLAETAGSGRVPFAATAPCRSPDGRRVVFTADADGYAQVHAIELPAGRPPRLGRAARSVRRTSSPQA
jgi:hypothetical protein